MNLKNAFFLFILLPSSIFAQQKKNITLEDIWVKGNFFGENFEGLSFTSDDKYYTLFETDIAGHSVFVKYAVQGGKKQIIIPSEDFKYRENYIEPESYIFNGSQDKILIATQTEHIYRRSSKSYYYLYDVPLKKLSRLSVGGKQSNASFSPDGRCVAFTRDNNLFYVELINGKEHQITNDGLFNHIINGSTDWVYEEEFEFTQAFFWSPDSKKIAFYKFDESEVPIYNMQVWSGLYPVDYRYKYPKAGEKNSKISIHIFSPESGNIVNLNTGKEMDNYIPRIKWTSNPDLLSITRLNRNQNHFEILHAQVSSGNITTAYEEKNNTYVEINDDLTYLKDGRSFLITSEKDGYKHIYFYNMDGTLINQVTQGNWEVDKFLGVDENKKVIYYTSTEVSPLERYLYRINYTGSTKKRITASTGTHEVTFSPSFNYFIDEVSTCEVPPSVTLNSSEGKIIKLLSDNTKLKNMLASYNIGKTEFIKFNTQNNISLNASILKPSNFDPQKKYPVFFFIYGGPGSQHVNNRWEGLNYAWFQMLSQKGYLIVTIDNRGTGGRGAEFKKMTQHQLGKYETQDLISAAKYLGALSYVNKDRIGIFGWSYGGYMASLAMTLGADYFKAGIAVAPVTSWRFYDTIYTERFLGQPNDNPSGYDDNSPLSHAALLKDAYLLVHGTADDNVHIQNTIEWEKALIAANKQFQVFYYPDKNHGIYGGNTRLHLYKMMTDFIEKNL